MRSVSATVKGTPSNSPPRRRSARRHQVARHIVVDIDLRPFGGSALTADLPVPKHDDVSEIGAGIPLTYVPARNTIFLSLALGWAETLDTGDLFVGVNAVDYSGYPDCRPEYIAAFESMANLATVLRGSWGTTRSHSCAAHPPDEGPDHSPGNGAGGRLFAHHQLLRSRSGRPGVWTLRLLPAPPSRIRRSCRTRPHAVPVTFKARSRRLLGRRRGRREAMEHGCGADPGTHTSPLRLGQSELSSVKMPGP